MRFRTLSFILLVVLVVASLPAVSATATPNRYPFQATQAAPVKCNDPELVGAIAADLKPIFDGLKTIPSTGAGGLYEIMVGITATRWKYEDMNTPTDEGCAYLATQAIIFLANVGDYGLAEMGDKLGYDAATVAENRKVTLDRVDKQMTALIDLIGDGK